MDGRLGIGLARGARPGDGLGEFVRLKIVARCAIFSATGRGWSPFLAEPSDPERFPLGPVDKIPNIVIETGNNPVFLIAVPFLANHDDARGIAIIDNVTLSKAIAVAVDGSTT